LKVLANLYSKLLLSGVDPRRVWLEGHQRTGGYGGHLEGRYIPAVSFVETNQRSQSTPGANQLFLPRRLGHMQAKQEFCEQAKLAGIWTGLKVHGHEIDGSSGKL
jgi:hypothetical protein